VLAAILEATGVSAPPSFGIVGVEVRGFRSAREVSFAPDAMCALVGEASTGKSNLLAAIRAVLDPAGAPLAASDLPEGGDGEVSIRLTLADGSEATLVGTPERYALTAPPSVPPTIFLSADARAAAAVAGSSASGPAAAQALEIFGDAFTRDRTTSAVQALTVLDALESCRSRRLSGLVLLIEEPELYLRPQAQRYLYRLLREFSLAGNQVIYATHSPAFLNVARLDELVLVERLPRSGTRAHQPAPVTPDEDFRVLTEFDAARSELFLARSVVLVEGLTEKLVLPFVFTALGHDVDRDAISVIECGGKPNIPLFARICDAVGLPFVVVHDSDRRAGGGITAAERALNALILETAGTERTIVLDPDFEAVAGLKGKSRKPARALKAFASRSAAEMPKPLVTAARLAISMAARSRQPSATSGL
jgi:predicted ATP-dependent endonuclease of OLD family